MFASRTSHRVLAVLAVCLFALTFGVTTSSANEVPWRDLGEATRQHNIAITLLADIDEALVSTDQEIASAASTLGFVEAREGDRLGTLEIWRTRSRELAVESYIHGGPGQASLALLNAQLSMDLSYQSELLRGQAEAALGASERYAKLVGGTDAEVIDFVEGIDALTERITGLETDRTRALAMIADAEWVVTIANVHALADEEFARTGRRDPTLNDWQELAFCESTNRYDVNTGNGFYGAYQFDYQTWFTVGGAPGTRADLAPAEEQDARARLLFARRGSQPWPECGFHLDS